jgi:hypothetical protein
MAPTGCKRTVSGTISLPCSGCFSPFPHGTGSLSVSQKYLALRDGPRSFRQDFTCPALLRILPIFIILACTGLSPSTIQLSRSIPFYIMNNIDSPSTPTLPKQYRFGLFPVRSPLLRESLLFSFPPGTKMFQFSGFASVWIRILHLHCSGLPHSEICGFSGYLLLPAAYRSLSRPSSPLRAKAFTIRSYLLSWVITLINFLANMSKNFSSCRFKVTCSRLKTPNFKLWTLNS